MPDECGHDVIPTFVLTHSQAAYDPICQSSSIIPTRASFHFGIFFLGFPVEKDFGRQMYTAFLVASGYLSTAIGAGVMLIFADGGIAFYGSSGIVFALAGYAVVALPRRERTLEQFETVAVFIGAISVGFVILDPITRPYLTVDWVNGGHLGGLIVGIAAGLTNVYTEKWTQ